MAKITKILSREILDSRATPTIETAVITDTGAVGIASVPSGASTGKSEAHELRDNDLSHMAGKGVLKAIANITNIIAPKLVGQEVSNQFEIDKMMIDLDGTENKEKFGANAILSVSLAILKATSVSYRMTHYQWVYKLAAAFGVAPNSYKIPTPIFNMINGGLHGAGNLDFQEFHVTPATNLPYSQGLNKCVTVYHFLKDSLGRRGAIHSVGDEGGYAPNLFTNVDALTIIVETIKESGFILGQDLFLGLDVASSAFYRDGKYQIRDRSAPLDQDGFISFYNNLNDQYHLALLEDPLYEDDWEGWAKLTASFAGKLWIVGDDLLATNPKRVQKAIETKSCNAILVKPNQIGTITETLQVIKLAKSAGWKVIVSHRSGETNDSIIADFAVGIGADFVKFGAPARGERVAKYNRLLAIEQELGLKK